MPKIKRLTKFIPKKFPPLKAPRINRAKLKKALSCFGYAIAVLALMTAIAFVWFSKDLPTPSKIANRKATESTKIYDRTGTVLLYETGEQKRTVVPSGQISQYLKDATVSVEDANFYEHHGFDPRAIASAIIEKITGRVNRARGGSTITQQYVKNSFLTSNRSMARKIKELILAVELEIMFNKDDILTAYLNEIPYGNGTAGAEAAARVYYGKQAKDLTLSQAAMLAAIPKAPSYYSPYGTRVKELVNRRDYVLDRMADTGKITKEEAARAKEEDTTTLGRALKPRRDTILSPHFAMYVIERVAEEFGEEKVQKEGLKIITTLDYDKQKIAEEAINNGADKFKRYGASNAALTAVDPRTGQILAMVGSKDYFDTSIDGNVNVADSLRQPGSSFKPFAYATAFKKAEYSPSKIIFDFQTDFGNYTPQNYNGKFNGPVTMRQALANSLNIPAVKVLSLAGIDNVLRTAEDMGITSLTQRDRYGLSLVLGAGEVRPVEMAGAFGVFANGGMKHDLKYALKITDSQGKNLYEYKQENDAARKVLDAQIAYEISSILSDNDSRALVFGTRTSLYFPDRPVAVKTGTTSSFKDAWSVGYTPSLAVAVWVGNSNATAMSKGADGSVIAAPIFHNFVEKALANTPAEEFARPDGIAEVEVDKFANKLPTEYSGDKTRDIFASWQVPTDKDDIHQAVKVCKGTALLAPDDLPENLVETKIYTNIHSERPDNSNWENPVRSWAEANGLANTPPKEYCDASSARPSIAIDQPKDGSEVSGEIVIAATVNSTFAVNSVEFFIDDISIGIDTDSPYSATFNTGTLASDKNHRISAIITDENGTTAKGDISVKVIKDGTPPTLSNISATYSVGSAAITWSTSEDSTSRVVFDTSSRISPSAYNRTSALNTILTKNHASALSGLVTGTTYYYRVISIDASGNQSLSDERIFVSL